MGSTTNLGWSLADSCALTIASYVFVAQAEQPQQGPSPMIHRVGQDYDRCPSEVIMCGRTLAGRALRCAPMVGSRREQSPRLAFTERADPAGSVARALELSVMVPSLVVSIRGAQRRSETVVAAGLRS